MPKNSNVQIEQSHNTPTQCGSVTELQSQSTPTPNHANPIIEGHESASRYGVASLELTCFDCMVDDIIYRRDAIINSLRSAAAQGRAIFDIEHYEPMRRPIDYCATFMQPVSFGVVLDVGVVGDDDIVAHADEIMAQLVHNFKRVGNAQGGAHG